MAEFVPVPFEDISYAIYLKTLLTEVHSRNIPIEIIGNDICEHTGIHYPLYKFTIHPEKIKTICIISGIHGDEVAGPLSIIRLIQLFKEELSKKFRYVVYPIINPSGFDLRRRFDDDYRDLNAIYKVTLSSKNYREVQALFSDLQNYDHFEAVITLHEDIDLEKFYMYGLGHHNQSFYHDLCSIGCKYCSPWKCADIYGCKSDEYGLVLSTARDHAYDGAMYKLGKTEAAFTFETPGKLPLEIRMNLMIEILIASSHLLARDE